MNNGCYINDSIFLKPILESEVQKYILKIKPSTSYVVNGLTNELLKNTYLNIYNPLTIIFNNSISNGKYPSSFKNCVITPIYKSGDSRICSNYRPIALSLTISKILEKCIKSRIMDFLLKYRFFSNNQYGFITNRYTEDAHFTANNYIRDTLDQNN